MRKNLLPLALLLFVLTCGSGLAAGGERRSREILSVSGLSEPTPVFRDQLLTSGPRAFAAAAKFSGGVYYAPDGTPIQIFASDFYIPSPEADQAVADLLGSLLHGSELAQVVVYVLSPDEEQAVCGEGNTACYAPFSRSLYMPGEAVDGIPLEQALAHEYGHHVSNFRLNTPWSAEDWGPKYWASQQSICPNVSESKLFPGADRRTPTTPSIPARAGLRPTAATTT